MRIKTILIALVAVFMAVTACATVSTNAGRNEYTAGAAQTIFNYTFKIYADTDLSVYLTPVGQEPDDTADLTTAYTVAGAGVDAGGSITLNSGTTSGDLVTIVSTIPTNRTIDYQFNGDFRPNVVNNDFDRAVSLVKQLENTSINTLKYQNSFQGGAGTLPDPVAGNVIGYDGAGQLTNLLLGVDGNSWDGLADLGDNAIGKGSDLVAHTGTADTVTEAIDKKFPIAGGTMTGSIILDGPGTTPLIRFNDSTNSTLFQHFVTSERMKGQVGYQTGGAATYTETIGSTKETYFWDVASAALARVLTTADAPLLGDGTPGRVMRTFAVSIQDGTAADTVKVTVSNIWNGDAISTTDDIAKGATVNGITLAPGGDSLSIATTGDALNVLSSSIRRNETATDYYLTGAITALNVNLQLFVLGSSTAADLTTVVNAGDVITQSTYLTDQ